MTKDSGNFPELSAEQRCGKGSRVISASFPPSEDGAFQGSPVPFLSPVTVALKDFQIVVLGTSMDRACGVRLPATHHLPS